MSTITRLLVSSVSLTLVSIGAAQAADYDPPIIIEEVPDVVPVEIGSGWYLRGDIGYSLKTSAKDPFTYRTFDGVNYGSAAFDSVSLSKDFSFGLGFGYSFTDWFRADATLDRFTAGFNGTTSSAVPCPGAPAGTTCRSEDGSEVTGYSALLNAYVDLGTYVGFTPYVGAGIGYTYMRWDELANSAYCVGGGCGGTSFAGTSRHSGESDWRFTYALMAGMSYDFSNNMKVDLGYRYRHVDGGNMFAWDAATAAAGATGVQGHDSDLATHEIRVGLRYELW
ncbi:MULTISPECIES: outer membrane protein [Nitratireductor]|uniref:outer membrane protein n=1 Tax=Nitratireductor TaxID=245876 RepID=UPI000DDCBE0E|nr:MULTISPECIES: outer membrane protein [Nitratireductor]MBN7761201.1 porin family protein [Nitratireductor aquibiodomus]MBN7777203.1 porin family protein [Nitratireductor pacificus]MBN7780874.1 porin family protein [Nitratireductor pacificus]MBN7789680.1 porin family protein [Nitratireductor aquimarinus]MBY6099412.1 porin family protein [Nitratireductor aquimarinus]